MVGVRAASRTGEALERAFLEIARDALRATRDLARARAAALSALVRLLIAEGDDLPAAIASVDPDAPALEVDPARLARGLSAARALVPSMMMGAEGAARAWERLVGRELATGPDGPRLEVGPGRRSRGAWRTPPALARALVEPALAAAAGPPGAPIDLAAACSLRILDPSAGGGALLVAAAEALAARVDRTRRPELLRALGETSLLGVEADPDGALLARAAIREATGAARPRVVHGDPLASAPLAALARDDAVLARALAAWRNGDARARTALAAAAASWRGDVAWSAPPVELELAFPDLAARRGACAVVLNPPFVAAYARGAHRLAPERARLLARRFPGKGGANGFLHFLALALEAVREGGGIGLLAPDALLVNARYEPARRALLEQVRDLRCRVVEGPAFEDAHVRVALVHATRGGPAPDATVEMHEDVASLDRARPRVVATAGRAQLELRPSLAFPRGPFDPDLEARVRAAGEPLEARAHVRDGVNPGPRWFRERVVVAGPASGPHVFPCLEGRDVARWSLASPRLALRGDPDLLDERARAAGASFREAWIFEGEKLVSRQTTARLAVARAPAGVRALNSVHLIVPRDRGDLLFLLAVLNSSVVSWYYLATSGETRDVFPQVHVAALAGLPVPRARAAERAELAGLARRLETDPADARAERALDRAVAALFGLGAEDLDRVLRALDSLLPRGRTPRLSRPGECS
jgi:hypothetical protein